MSFKYHVALNLTDQNCLVVGGGSVAQRKIKRLLEAKAKVHVVSLAMSEGVRALLPFCTEHRVGSFLREDLDNMFLVIAATDCKDVNDQIATICHQKGILINVVDAPELSSFIVNASINDGDFTISFSTGGKSPGFTKQFREHAMSLFNNKEYGLALDIFEHVRNLVLERVPEIDQRQEILKRLLLEKILDDLDVLGYEETLKRVDTWLSYYLD